MTASVVHGYEDRKRKSEGCGAEERAEEQQAFDLTALLKPEGLMITTVGR